MFSKKKSLNIKLTKEEIYFLMESAYLSRDLGRHQESVDIFLGVTALTPEEPLPAAAIGSVLLESGKADDAVSHLEKTLKVFPEDPLVMAHLGEALLCKSRNDNSRAKDLFQRSVAKSPKSPAADIAQSYLKLLAEIDKK